MNALLPKNENQEQKSKVSIEINQDQKKDKSYLNKFVKLDRNLYSNNNPSEELKKYREGKTVVINSKDFVFRSKGYDEKKIGKFLTEEEFEAIIFQINKLSLQALLKYKRESTAKVNKFIFLVMFLILVFFGGGVFFGISAREFHEDHPLSFNLPLLFCILFLLCVCGALLVFSIQNFHLKSKTKSVAEQTQIYIEQFLAILNIHFQNKLLWRYDPVEQIIKIINMDISSSGSKGFILFQEQKKANIKKEEIDKKYIRKIFEEEDDDKKQIENELFNQWWNSDKQLSDADDDEELELCKDKKLGKVKAKKRYQYRDFFKSFVSDNKKDDRIRIFKEAIGKKNFDKMIATDSKQTKYYDNFSTLY